MTDEDKAAAVYALVERQQFLRAALEQFQKAAEEATKEACRLQAELVQVGGELERLTMGAEELPRG